MKNNEKSLMEEILGRKKDNSKNELLDNDDTLLNSTVHSLPKTEKSQNNYSQNSETNKNNIPEVPFTVGTLESKISVPIIGPPKITLSSLVIFNSRTIW